MLIFYLVLFFSMLIGFRFKGSGYFDGFLDKRQTDTIKGFFILMVFISHALLAVRSSGYSSLRCIDIIGFRIRSEFGQLIVVPFLFYSGFGVMESIKNGGQHYLNIFPRRRLLTTLMNFDVAVLCFIVLNLCMGIHMNMKQIALSFIGWNSVGNSNWYIFVILFCYSATWISGEFFPYSKTKMIALTVLIIFMGEIALSFLKRGSPWWYNTMLCYPTGVLFSLFKDRLTVVFKRFYFLFFIFILSAFLFLHLQVWLPDFRGLIFNLKAIFFAILIVLCSMKIKTRNAFLYWAGINVFPIYIYQRLPMRALQHWAGNQWICTSPYLFITICAFVSGCIVVLYKYWRIRFQ